MAAPRTLRITIEVVDDGGPDDYDFIARTLMSIGADITDEQEV